MKSGGCCFVVNFNMFYFDLLSLHWQALNRVKNIVCHNLVLAFSFPFFLKKKIDRCVCNFA